MTLFSCILFKKAVKKPSIILDLISYRLRTKSIKVQQAGEFKIGPLPSAGKLVAHLVIRHLPSARNLIPRHLSLIS
jgi:hypothetical protein